MADIGKTRSGDRHLLRTQVILVGALAMLALLATLLPTQEVSISMGHYLPLHSGLEFLAIVAAFLVFATVWHTPEKKTSASLLLIATALFAAGWLDYFHVQSFKGMPDLISPASVEKSIALWLAARTVVAVTLLGISFYPRLRPPSLRMKYGALAAYAVVNLVVLVGVFFFESSLPHMFEDGVGLTRLKVVAEWAITGMLAVAAWRYHRQAQHSGGGFPALIFSATAVAALGETFFMGYTYVSDVQSLLGHLYKVVSYSLIYQAMFVTSVRKPYDLLAEKKQLLEQANETLRIQSLALESTSVFVLVTDLQGRVRWRNRTSHQFLNDPVQGGPSAYSLYAAPITPDPAAASVLRDVLSAGKSWRGLVEVQDGRGNRITVDRTVTPLRDESGVVEGFVSVAEDVTENRRAQERHKRVLGTAIDGFWIADAQGNLLEVNAAFARMSGYTEQELAGMNVRQLGPVSHIAQMLAYLQEGVSLGHDQFETQLQHKSGHDFSVEISVTFDPELQQFFAFLRDITERLQSASAKLDLERQLQQSQKMQALGQLTGGIAHDFNNILVSVLGYSKLALDRLVPDKQSKLASYLREVILASERARDLIAKMLVFTRTRSSGGVGVIAPGAVVQEVLAMVRPSMPSSIALDVRLEDDLNIVMDAGELNQILINLVINARDAIDGHGVIGIRLHRVEANGKLCAVSHQRLYGSYLALEVTDTGSGIAPEHMPRLFDPFFTTKDVGKGTGLGLSMVQGILLRAGGHIVVESRPGSGSMFQLLFPITSAMAPGQDSLPDDPASLRGAGQHIGVVDDEPAVTRYLTELLEGQGYRVTQFNRPADALAVMEGAIQDFDLLIADQTMPGMSGTELAVRLHGMRPDFPVVLCTGHSGAIAPADLLQAHIRHCFMKPVPAHELLKALADELVTKIKVSG